MPWTKKKAQDAVPWAYRYAFPRLRRANLIAHQGDKKAAKFKSTRIALNTQEGIQQ